MRFGRNKVAGLGPAQNLHGIAMIKSLAGEQLVQDDPHGKEIRALIDPFALGLFGRHIGHLALEHPRFRRGVAIGDFGNAEIENFDLPGIGHKNILGADVAMNDLQQVTGHVRKPVGIFQTGTDGSRNGKAVFEPERPSGVRQGGCQGTQILALEIFHDNEIGVLHASEIVNLDDVGMLQEGRQFGFCDKRLHHLRIDREVGVHLFDGHQFLKPLVALNAGTEKLRHAAIGDAVQDLVFAELSKRFHR